MNGRKQEPKHETNFAVVFVNTLYAVFIWMQPFGERRCANQHCGHKLQIISKSYVKTDL